MDHHLLGRSGRGLFRRRFLEAIGAAEFLTESLHPPGRIHKLLLAREERMARRTDIDIDLGHGAAGGERVPARTVGRTVLISGMNLGFHLNQLLSPDVRAAHF